MFTLNQILEIQGKLQALGKKDSEFPEASQLTGEEKLVILQDGENKTIQLDKLSDWIKYGEIHENVTLTILSDTPGTIITLNDEIRNSITVRKGELVAIKIEASGYKSFMEIVAVTKTQTITIDLEKEEYNPQPSEDCTFTVTTEPYDAYVKIDGEFTRSVTVKAGTSVLVEVAAAGYITQRENVTVTYNGQTKHYVLSEEGEVPVNVTLTVVPTPSDADVYLNGSRTNTITVPENTQVSIRVEAPGYITHEEVVTVTNDWNYPITLEEASPDMCTLTVSATPSGSTIKINGTERTSITVEKGTSVTVEVSKLYYVTQTKQVTVTQTTQRETISLVKDTGTLTVTASPSNATIKLNGQVRSGNKITVDLGTTVDVEVSASGYQTKKDSIFVDEKIESHHVTLSEDIPDTYNFTIVPVPSDATVKINGTVRTSIQVKGGEVLEIEVSKTGYVTHKQDYTVPSDINSDITEEIRLTEAVETSWSNLEIVNKTGDYGAVSPDGGSFTVQATVTAHKNDNTSIEDKVVNSVTWTAVGEGLTSDGNGSFTWSENPGTTARTGKIKASVTGPDNNVLTAEATTTQVGDEPYLSLDKTTLTFEAAGGTQTINISSNTSWTIS